jgi:gliding motility-associated-like protein
MTGMSAVVFSQIPQIQKVEPLSTYPNKRILISGSGFSNTSSQLQVWFDQVKGNIITSSIYNIEVDVPPNARLSNIEVINLASGLAAKSNLKFMPSFSGELFNATKFAAPLSIASTTEVWDLCSCDFNDDSKPDMVSTKFFSPSNSLMVLQNQSVPGTMLFSKTDLGLSFPSDNAVCGDLNGDGKPDLVVSRSGSPRNSIHVLRNTSAASVSFVLGVNLFLDVGHFATRIIIRDLNLDGKAELIVTNSFNNVLYIFQNTSSGGTISFNPTPIKISVNGAATTYGIEVQNFDNDNLPDIALTPFQTSDIFLLRNQSGTTISFGSAQKVTLISSLNGILSADFNQDNKLDLVLTSTLNNQAHILLNQSTGSTFLFAAPLNLTTSNGPWGIDVSDIDGDGDPDVVVANRNEAVMNVFLHSGNFTAPSFSKADIATSKPSRNVKAGDLDGDSKPDLAVTTFNAGSGIYTLDILRNTNCHQPKILNDQPLTICAGQTIRLQTIPASNMTFVWKQAGSTVKSSIDPFIDVTIADTYTVTAVGEGGTCSVTSAPIIIGSNAGTAPADPVINTSSPLCSSSDINLSTAVVPGGTYSWTGPNNFTSVQQNPIINNVGIDQAGKYNLQVAIGACKSNVVSHTVDVVDLEDLSTISSVPSNKICQGNSLVLSVTNDPDFTYQWIKDGSDILGQTTNTLNVTQTGSYSARVFNATVSCTKTTVPVSVTVLAPPVSAFSADAQACVGEQLTFTNQSTSDPLATTIISWNFGDGNSSSAISPIHSYSTAQAFSSSLQLSYAGVSGCFNSSNKSVLVTNSIPPVISATFEEICPQQSSTLSISNSYTGIRWSNNDTGNEITVNLAGTFSVSAVDAKGCNVTDDIVIKSKPIPTIQVTASKNVIGPGESVQLEAMGADTYEWSPATSLNSSTIFNPEATPNLTITYTVNGQLTNGCSAENTITITIDDANIRIKPLPAFSPNGDGSNELWTIEGVEGYPDCILAVFDGRGRRVYERKGYSSDWDGAYQGKPVPDGTYFFVFGCPDKRPVTGSVLVFR